MDVDWTLILINCMSTLPATIAAVVAAWATIHAHLRNKRAHEQTQKIVNGRMDGLIQLAETKGKAQGHLEEIKDPTSPIPQPPTELRVEIRSEQPKED